MSSSSTTAAIALGGLGLLVMGGAVATWVTFDIASKERDRREAREILKQTERMIDKAIDQTEAGEGPRSPPHQPDDDELARLAARSAVRKQGLGDLIIGEVRGGTPKWTITGTAVDRDDSRPVTCVVTKTAAGSFSTAVTRKK